jgi:hypothetical protein
MEQSILGFCRVLPLEMEWQSAEWARGFLGDLKKKTAFFG